MRTFPDDVFLFRGLSLDERNRLLAEAPPPERFEKGEIIYSAERFRRAVGVVLRGEVLVVRDAAVLNRLGAGAVFGAAALYGRETRYVTEVRAATATELLFFDEALLNVWMRRDFRIAENYIGFLSDRIRFLNGRIAAFTAGDAEGRVLVYLRQHSDENGLVTLPHGMSELSRMLDIGRTSLYRSLDTLAADGKIRREGKSIYILKTIKENAL